MRCKSECRDLDKSVKCSLWFDDVLGVYSIHGKPGEPVIFEKDEQVAWKIYRASMLEGTNGMGIYQDRQSGIPLSLKR